MTGFEMILPFLKPIEHVILDDTSAMLIEWRYVDADESENYKA